MNKLIWFAAFALVSTAHASDISVSVEGLINTTSITNYGTTVYSSGMTFGGGVFGELSVFPGFAVQLGAMFAPRTVQTSPASVPTNDSGTTVVINQNLNFTALEVPLLLRYVALPFIDLGVGGYYAAFLGQVTTSTNNQDVLPSYSSSYGSLNRASSDVGIEVEADFHYPVAPMVNVVVDARYLLGLTNIDATGTTSQHFRNIELLLGASLSL